jgi:beta-1,4-N-acetylglucosaminyltransferase
MSPRRRILAVSSVGGHLTELLALREAFEGHEVVWVLNDPSPVLPEGERFHLVTHAERDWRQLLNVAELGRILLTELPDLVVSMGASVAVPAGLLARLLGIPVIFIEPSSAVRHLTLTGRLMRRIAHRFYVQWPSLARRHPPAEFRGSVL